MGITYGDHLIDSGYHDITPEQEREIARCADCPARYANGGCDHCDEGAGMLDAAPPAASADAVREHAALVEIAGWQNTEAGYGKAAAIARAALSAPVAGADAGKSEAWFPKYEAVLDKARDLVGCNHDGVNTERLPDYLALASTDGNTTKEGA